MRRVRVEEKLILTLIIHIALAQAMHASSLVATIHAYACMLYFMRWVISGNLFKTAEATAYITGCEVLWRMSGAVIFWEYGKYAVIFLMLVAMMNRGFGKNRMPFFYFALLLPSVLVTSFSPMTDPERLRSMISFNLSGPLALCICALFFSKASFTKEQLYKIFFALVVPCVGILSIAVYGVYSKPDIHFGTESNILTSGGYSPNQVSAMFGLCLAVLFFYLVGNKKSKLRFLLFILMILFAAQSALTFSRGGLYMAAVCIFASSFYLLKSNKARAKVCGLILATVLVAQFAIPFLSNFTGGALEKRFKSKSLTGRETLMRQDLLAWKENPVFGVGIGLMKEFRSSNNANDGIAKYGRIAAHTEFTRLLGEHGIFGVGAILMLLFIGIRNVRRARSTLQKALCVSMMLWAMAFLAANGMRIVAPSFIFGLASLNLLPDFVPPRNRSSQTQPPLKKITDLPKEPS